MSEELLKKMRELRAGLLLRPSETGNDFEQKYFAALQSDPDIVLAHREVTKII